MERERQWAGCQGFWDTRRTQSQVFRKDRLAWKWKPRKTFPGVVGESNHFLKGFEGQLVFGETQLSVGLGRAVLEKEMVTHCSILVWKIPWMEEPGQLQSMGLQSRTWLSDFCFCFSLSLGRAVKPQRRVEVTGCFEDVWLKSQRAQHKFQERVRDWNRARDMTGWGSLEAMKVT